MKRVFSIIVLIVFSSVASFGQEKVTVKKVSEHYKTLVTEIVIDATPDKVWTVLTDTESYERWAKFMKKVDGKICDQCSVDVFFSLDNSSELTKINRTITVIEGKEFKWSQPFGGGILDNHRFIVKPYGKDKAKFIQSDFVKGDAGNWQYAEQFFELEKTNYPVFNRSLKEEVERRSGK